jgi:acetyl/propionyl-CoA carboxylase alpha subunit
MYVEKLVLRPHHVEIQVFGDGKGRAIHLGERECSIQRRHQKIWEESPSPILERFPKTRPAMYEAAVKVAEHVKYAGAGTFEFVVDEQGKFYFLEMNTRLQVEHPVTEWVTGVDLVAWQLLLATGELELPTAAPERRGSAIEVRLYAEDPRTFLPAPGALGFIQLPQGGFVRVDSAFTGPGEVSFQYDPMIAKVSVWAPTRVEAVARLRVALDEARVLPPRKRDGSFAGSLRSNLPFLQRLVRDERVMAGDTATDLIASRPELTAAPASNPDLGGALAASLAQLLAETETVPRVGGIASLGWASVAMLEGVRT